MEEIEASLTSVLARLRRGNFQLLHVICHGKVNEANPDISTLYLNDGKKLTPRDIVGETAKFATEHPLVFFNVCSTARLGYSLTGIGGWAVRLINAGVGAFIAPFWAVEDELAKTFAIAFYKALLSGKPIAQACFEGRKKAKIADKSNPTWLAYCLYADPLAQIKCWSELAKDIIREKTSSGG